ncbi:MAG: GNAT family N-acetyltransferase [Pseudonocardia sp.]|nr:GNAT family N-acetyltransferase [Pseudonocardia sp.]
MDKPHPDLATPMAGLELRELTEADAEAYYDMVERNRAHIARYGDHQDERRASRRDMCGDLENPPCPNIRYGIWLGDRLIGRADLAPVDPPRYSLGYWLDEWHTGRGYTTAACAALIEYARTELCASDIVAGVAHGNAKSVAVLERLGFRPVSELETYTQYRLQLG